MMVPGPVARRCASVVGECELLIRVLKGSGCLRRLVGWRWGVWFDWSPEGTSEPMGGEDLDFLMGCEEAKFRIDSPVLE